jgi:hypothetical protein
MYYDRTISDEFENLILENGGLRWLIDYVKSTEDIDFLIGKNNNIEWISLYRGLSRILRISKNPRVQDLGRIKLDADKAYMELMPVLYNNNINTNFESNLENLLQRVRVNDRFKSYYNNKKEGYYQNQISRRYGIDGLKDDPFVIIDKESVIGFQDNIEKDRIITPLKSPYKELQADISRIDSKRYGKDLQKKSVGNELDFVALDKNGNILLIELKDSSNTSGIYLSPIEIGMYSDLFSFYKKYKEKERENLLIESISEMLKQKQSIGLINPEWKPKEITGKIIPWLVISNHKPSSSAGIKFNEIIKIAREREGYNDFLSDIKVFNCEEDSTLSELDNNTGAIDLDIWHK